MKGLTAGIVTAFFLFAFAGWASGASVTGQLNIHVTVPPTLEFSIVHKKNELKITKSDVKNGYKELNKWTSISVTTNVANGYVISVSAQPLVSAEDKEEKKDKKHKKYRDGEDSAVEVYTYVTVTADGRSFGITPGGSVDIQMPATSKTNDATKLSYRFTLSPGVELGTYPCPTVVTVYPL